MNKEAFKLDSKHIGPTYYKNVSKIPREKDQFSFNGESEI
jgi:hypothetical protein